MKTLYLIRGPSGSGKSTIAKALGGIPLENHWEADMYFVLNERDEYRFDKTKLGEAHRWCQDSVQSTLDDYAYIEKSGTKVPDRIIVSNTFMSLKEMQPYLDFAQAAGYNVVIYRTPRPWLSENLVKRNFHGVTGDVIARQISRYQIHESEAEWTDLSIFGA